MKKIFIALFLSLICVPTIHAQKWLKKARLAQVSIIAYDAAGNMNESQGVLVNDSGSVITEYDALKGANKITVVDAEGQEYIAKCLEGASSMYNTVKLQIELPQKNKLESLTPTPTAMKEGDIVYILPNARADKKVPCTTDTITKCETFRDSLSYYSLKGLENERLNFSPVLNEAGELVAILQPAAKGGKNSFAIDSRFGAEMKIAPMDAGNSDLKAINVRKALPSTAEDAASYIFLTGTRDTALYMSYVNEYMQRYPAQTNGYTMKAEFLALTGQYQQAEETYQAALQQPDIKQDEIHYSWAKVLYDLNIKSSYKVYNDWNLEKCLSEAEAAYSINPLPVYLNTQGSCLYALKRYDDAYQKYMELSKTNMRSPDNFLYAAQCREMAGAAPEDILALQDSAVNCFQKPYPVEAANYILMRGTTLGKMEKYRDAVADYNEYEHLMSSQLTANFYYEREQLEVKCRMFPAALNDIERAVRMNEKEPVFRAEEASLNYRVGQVDEAIAACQAAIQLDAKFPDAYRILGVCYNNKGDKVKAKQNLQKAIELGDTVAQGILDKMQ